MNIAVISNTHGILRPRVKEIIRICDTVIHAGDFDNKRCFDEIASLAQPNAKLYAVCGNCDYWTDELPISREFELCGKRFFLILST